MNIPQEEELEIKKHIQGLPEELKIAVRTLRDNAVLKEISEKYTLTPDTASALYNELVLTLSGITPLDAYPQKLRGVLSDRPETQEMLRILNDKLIDPLKTTLQRASFEERFVGTIIAESPEETTTPVTPTEEQPPKPDVKIEATAQLPSVVATKLSAPSQQQTDYAQVALPPETSRISAVTLPEAPVAPKPRISTIQKSDPYRESVE